MNDNPLLALKALGQHVWLDNLSRTLLQEGGLQRLMSEDGIDGVTSNPAIFHKAIAGSPYYRDDLERLRGSKLGAEARYESLVIPDIQAASTPPPGANRSPQIPTEPPDGSRTRTGPESSEARSLRAYRQRWACVAEGLPAQAPATLPASASRASGHPGSSRFRRDQAGWAWRTIPRNAGDSRFPDSCPRYCSTRESSGYQASHSGTGVPSGYAAQREREGSLDDVSRRARTPASGRGISGTSTSR